jgi:hypothetical protein
VRSPFAPNYFGAAVIRANERGTILATGGNAAGGFRARLSKRKLASAFSTVCPAPNVGHATQRRNPGKIKCSRGTAAAWKASPSKRFADAGASKLVHQFQEVI